MVRKLQRLDKVKLLKEISRERVGPPKPGKMLKSKKKARLDKAILQEISEDLSYLKKL